MPMSYEQVAALFAKYRGRGRGVHLNHASTTRAKNPQWLYMPKSSSTTESDPYGAWDKVCLFADAAPHLEFVTEAADSRIYRLKPAGKAPGSQPLRISGAHSSVPSTKGPTQPNQTAPTQPPPTNQERKQMEIKFDDNIPIPTDAKRAGKYQWQEMKVGQSFWSASKPTSLRNIANQAGKRLNMKFLTRAETKDGIEGSRVWRTG